MGRAKATPMTLVSRSALAFALGVLIALAVDLHAARPALALVALAAGAIALPSIGRPRLAEAAAAVAFFTSGLALPASPPALSLPASGLYRIELATERTEHGARDSSVVGTIAAAERVEDGARLDPGLRARLRGTLPPGARVRVLARLDPVRRFRNPSPAAPPPDRRIHVRGRLVGEAETISSSTWSASVEEARGWVRAHLRRTLAPGPSGMARALVLGDRRAVDALRREAVRGAGLAHVLAVSGLHVAVSVGLFVAIVAFCLRRAPLLARRVATDRIAFAVGMPAALLYAELAGAAPSARRAALTACLAFGVRALGRRPSPIPLAIVAIALLALSSPGELRDPGLVLSVIATLAVVTATVPNDTHPWARIRALAVVSARATIATAPVIWWCFGAVPLVGLIANVALAPLASALLIPLALLHTTLGALGSLPCALTAALFEHVESAFSTTCALFSAARWGQDLPPPTTFQVIGLGIGAVSLLLARDAKRALLVLAITAAAVLGGEAHLRWTERTDGQTRVTFVDVGQGDGVIVELPDGETLTIDGGGGSARPGLRAMLPLLRARRIDRIDVAVLTHPHPDHYEGLGEILGRIAVGEVWDSGQGPAEEPDGPVAQLLNRARSLGAVIREPRDLCGLTRRHGGATLEVLAPCPRYDAGWDPNDNSVVLSLRHGATRFLFAGDAEAHQESVLADLGPRVRADVLKVAHHGSRTSSTPAFLEAVRPQLSVISAGVHNRYGHPHDEVYARLARAGHVRSTARDGGITVITDGRTIRVSPLSGPRLALSSRRGSR